MVADRTNLSKTMILNILKEAGVPLRPRGNPKLSKR
jgi:hypothetical protein